MARNIECGRRVRKDFGKIPSIVEIPNLIEIQQQSYEQFLQKEIAPERREENGLQAVFKSVFPIQDYNGNATLEFHSYHFGDPKYTVEECHDRGMTFAIPLKVTLRLKVIDNDKETKTQTVREVREQEVYLGELPLMTEKGTFIINGTERVVVSQLQRSAGVFFDDDKGKTVASGKLLFSARVIPYRGSWVEFEFDANDILFVRVDRRRKMLATAFLRAFWFLEKGVILSDEEILSQFYDLEEVLSFEDRVAWVKLHPEAHNGVKVADDVRLPRHREALVLGLHLEDRRPLALHAAHGVGLAERRAAGEAVLVLLPAHGILGHQLHARRPSRVELRHLRHAALLELGDDRVGVPMEGRTLAARASVAGAAHHQRERALREHEAEVQRGEAAHRQADHVGLVDLEVIENGLDVLGGLGLRVALRVTRDIRGRVAAGVEGDRAVPPGEELHLRRPAMEIVGELVNEEDRRALPDLLVVQLDAVGSRRVGHQSITPSRGS